MSLEVKEAGSAKACPESREIGTDAVGAQQPLAALWISSFPPTPPH